MATITPVVPGMVATAVNAITPTATDTIPCAAYRAVILVVRTGGTNTYTGKVDDPSSVGPVGATSFDPDLTVGSVPISSARAVFLDCARFRDSNGSINITSSSTFTGTTLEAYGVPV